VLQGSQCSLVFRMLLANTCASMVCAVDTSTGEIHFLSIMTAISSVSFCRIWAMSKSMLVLMLGDLEGLIAALSLLQDCASVPV